MGQRAQRPAGQTGQCALEDRTTDLLTARHVAGRGRHHHPAFDQPDELVDLPGIIASVRHGHHDHRRGRRVDPEPDGVGRPTTVGIDQAPQPRLLLRVLFGHGDGRVFGRVDDHEYLARQPHRLEQPVKHAGDLLTLVVGGDHHRDARTFGHTRTPFESSSCPTATVPPD